MGVISIVANVQGVKDKVETKISDLDGPLILHTYFFGKTLQYLYPGLDP